MGSKRKKLLLRRFKSFAGLQRAQRAEIQESLGPTLGARLFDHLHRDKTEKKTVETRKGS